MPTRRPRKAAAKTRAQTAPAKPDGEQEAPPEPSPQEAPPEAEPQEAGEKKRYVALNAMGSTRRGEEFEAYPDDRRVRSGYAQEVVPEQPPDAVSDALS